MRMCGVEIRRTRAESYWRAERERRRRAKNWSFLRTLSPGTILDIGANEGQFAELVRPLVPDACIISFEPLSGCAAVLEAKRDCLEPFHLVRAALGEVAGEVEMNRNEFTPSSSLLEMEPLHVAELPDTANSVAERVSVRRLDDVATELQISRPLVIKIDVQGYEARVLIGGPRTVRSAAVVVAEVSAYPLYRGEATFEELYDLMKSYGFAYRGNVDRWLSPRDGRILQFDAMFENLDPAAASPSRAISDEGSDR
ncbi:hypothetical protein LzC2_23070 [Planctomycetes bacterium LzC2]|uniref:Methyltransferase FkbM domain-containing protein n=2 Tax=Alienimonas chondri TaxID=2681879 RepID=A0ABX1VFL0_9PLAN|nr:hypothetical protein [Alienimonas chondri]